MKEEIVKEFEMFYVVVQTIVKEDDSASMRGVLVFNNDYDRLNVIGRDCEDRWSAVNSVLEKAFGLTKEGE